MTIAGACSSTGFGFDRARSTPRAAFSNWAAVENLARSTHIASSATVATRVVARTCAYNTRPEPKRSASNGSSRKHRATRTRSRAVGTVIPNLQLPSRLPSRHPTRPTRELLDQLLIRQPRHIHRHDHDANHNIRQFRSPRTAIKHRK